MKMKTSNDASKREKSETGVPCSSNNSRYRGKKEAKRLAGWLAKPIGDQS